MIKLLAVNLTTEDEAQSFLESLADAISDHDFESDEDVTL